VATATLYNHTRARFLDGTFKVGDTYRISLYSSLEFNAEAITKAQAEEGGVQLPTANGYVQEGQALTGVAVSIVNTNEAKLSANNPSWTASGGALVASDALVFNDTHPSDAPVLHIRFDSPVAANDGEPLVIPWSSEGIITSKAPA